jgi:CheY-like chemotaxis protein
MTRDQLASLDRAGRTADRGTGRAGEPGRAMPHRRAASGGIVPAQHTVLVVDDDANVRSLYVDALEESGHLVMTATDGLDAMRRLNDGAAPCVVLADVRMPRMDGFELARAVGRDPRLASMPVVVMTGDKILSFTSPALDKPFSVPELDSLVHRSCVVHRGSDA